MIYDTDIAITLIIIMMIIMIGALGLIHHEIRKIEKKIENPDDRPKYRKHWGNH